MDKEYIRILVSQDSTMGCFRKTLNFELFFSSTGKKLGGRVLYVIGSYNMIMADSATLLENGINTSSLISVTWYDAFDVNFYQVSLRPIELHLRKHFTTCNAFPYVASHLHSLDCLHEKEAMSLVCLCLVPYLRAKLEDRITQYQLEGIPRGWGQVLLRLHSALHLVWESSILGNYLYYMSGNTPTHSPLLRLAGVTLQYAADMEEETKYPLWSAKSLKYVLMRTMELGAFFLQFLQWWHAEDKLRSSFTALPLPPAPEVSAEAKQYSGICPICLQNRKIETVLPVSGYVFCYRCIMQYVQEHHCCPVTKYPADMRDLIRVYASDS
ncbi:hypothetical protein ANN_28115 [Periplaneta americana]|uniref:Peroxisome assembly protein 12 n=1 Tax=Periplaneta americana TaxID=6978 RepID=A0ABQ8S620_PERAM|nr:hypothetical protein ANN_28115 [Periplaneta americana]